VARRRALVQRYDERLAPLSPKVRPVARTTGCVPAWHLYVALIDFAAIGKDRKAVMTALREYGVGTQVHYIPVAWQPYYRARYGDADLPGAAAYYARCLSLPLYPAMTHDDVDRVVQALATVIGSA
jgi:dTDP-4-amino-4,6-dideoxygalactose transaminase